MILQDWGRGSMAALGELKTLALDHLNSSGKGRLMFWADVLG